VKEKEKNNEGEIINVWDVFPNGEFYSYIETLTENDKENYLDYFYTKHYYWLFFLPLPRHAHILVIDDSPGLVSMLLMFMGHNVVAVSKNKESRNFWSQEVCDAKGGSYLEKSGDITTILEQNESRYDAIIVNNLLHIAGIASGDSKDIADIIRRITTVKREEGLLWVGGNNPKYFRNLFKGKESNRINKKIWSIIESTLFRNGSRIQEFHELKPSYSAPEEVAILISRKLKNREKLKKKPSGIKEISRRLIPQSVINKYLSPAYGALFIFDEKHRYVSFIEELEMELLGSDGIIEKIYLGNPDTLILKLVNREQNVIARIPFTQEAKDRCKRSQMALESLDWLMHDGVRLTPTAEKKLVLNGLHVYTESAIFGEPIDGASCRGIQFIDKAIEIITSLHLATASNTIISEEIYNELIGALIGNLEKNLHPSFAGKIRWLSAYFKQSFLNKSIPLVFSHGDYKLENILVKREDCSLVGVIDWDLSVENGMPLVDIIHLLAYEKHVESNQPIDEVITKQWVAGQHSLEKKDCILVDQYMSMLNIPKELFKPLVGFYWLDNVAKRFSTNGKYYSTEFVEQFVLPVFDEIIDKSINITSQ